MMLMGVLAMNIALGRMLALVNTSFCLPLSNWLFLVLGFQQDKRQDRMDVGTTRNQGDSVLGSANSMAMA
jgi:hypothetical protein